MCRANCTLFTLAFLLQINVYYFLLLWKKKTEVGYLNHSYWRRLVMRMVSWNPFQLKMHEIHSMFKLHFLISLYVDRSCIWESFYCWKCAELDIIDIYSLLDQYPKCAVNFMTKMHQKVSEFSISRSVLCAHCFLYVVKDFQKYQQYPCECCTLYLKKPILFVTDTLYNYKTAGTYLLW